MENSTTTCQQAVSLTSLLNAAYHHTLFYPTLQAMAQRKAAEAEAKAEREASDAEANAEPTNSISYIDAASEGAAALRNGSQATPWSRRQKRARMQRETAEEEAERARKAEAERMERECKVRVLCCSRGKENRDALDTHTHART